MATKKSGRISLKQVMIDKSNSTMVTVAAIAAFVTVFSLVAVKSLVSQMLYQNKVIDAKKTTLSQLKDNLKARDTLVQSYKNFVGNDTNVIGGSSIGSGGNNGDNAQIITDALPYTYDFPALATTLEKMITTDGLKINAITGTDDQVQQQTNQSSPNPQAVAIPFTIQVSGSYENLQKLITDLQRSIRPFVVTKISLSSGGSAADGRAADMSLDISAQTYYQPAKNLQITKEVIK